jgi:hypothetical protein
MRLADLIKVSDVFNMNWVLNSRTAGLPEEESDHRFATPNGWARNSLTEKFAHFSTFAPKLF